MPTKRRKVGSFRFDMPAISSLETPPSDFSDSFRAKFAECNFCSAAGAVVATDSTSANADHNNGTTLHS